MRAHTITYMYLCSRILHQPFMCFTHDWSYSYMYMLIERHVVIYKNLNDMLMLAMIITLIWLIMVANCHQIASIWLKDVSRATQIIALMCSTLNVKAFADIGQWSLPWFAQPQMVQRSPDDGCEWPLTSLHGFPRSYKMTHKDAKNWSNLCLR